MNNLVDIRHDEIKDYILDECTSENLEKIYSLKKKNSALTQFLDIIDDLKSKSKPSKKRNVETIPDSFSDIDSIILEIQSGNVDSDYAQKILTWILQSPSFFEKLCTKLDQVNSLHVDTELPELQEIAIKSDEELLEKAGIFQKKVETESQSIIEKVKKYINNMIDTIASWFQEKPKLAYSLSTALVTVLIMVMLLIPSTQKDPFESYIFTDNVPYEYDISSLRGQTDDSSVDPLFESFKNEFKMGISDYMICEYESAILTWDKLLPTALDLENKSPNMDYLPWIRELYFYLGVSHLAAARSKNIESQDNKNHLKQSIQHVIQAKSLISKYSLNKMDRERYFLGLAYGISGNKKSAIEEFKKIKTSDNFFNESQKFINELQKK